MKKLISLIKAVFSEDMNLFKYKTKANSNSFKKIVFPLFLACIVMYAVGTYFYLIAEPLAKVNLTYVMLSVVLLLVTALTFIEGIYKSGAILFDAKDNDLLFSLPIKKSHILYVRIFKLLVFQFLYNLLILLPAFIIYIYFESPGVLFYLISFISLFIIPIIPTTLSCIIGYFIKHLTSKFKAKKIVQSVLTAIVMIIIFFLSFQLENIMDNIVENATSINDILTKVYYPIGAYNSLINKFDILELIKVLLFNIIPFILFVYLGSIYYFKIISKNNEYGLISSKKKKIKVKSKLSSLISKELSRFFSSTVYIFNSSFGIILFVAVTIILCIKGNNIGEMFMIEGSDGFDILENIHLVYCGLVIFVGSMTSITSSSISLEGKGINITKSLPVSTKTILKSKVLTSLIITLPLILIGDLIFIIRFNIEFIYIIYILLLSIVVPSLTAIIGLLVNLKYPKLEFSNDTEVVKQSLSSGISVFIGMIIFVLSVLALVTFHNEAIIAILIMIAVFTILTVALWQLLCNYGSKLFSKLNY